IYIGGGVSHNQRLRTLFSEQNLEVFWPPKGLSLDNGAMIAGLGFHVYQKQGKGDPLNLEPQTRISLEV
ncbi:MAG: tRNA (adenosine(37)-N6)-threonylcarbamoyltransferase complex transferase subunit TsaD, partial [Verrucomicrobia bacterium]|nr:tRNA (adenosine(37)-N6)-threonylcarbamoyltransferase complex transferase subunit TsaD [Verrucomicrobiota bacterium]